MFIKEIARGTATLHVHQDDCQYLATLLAEAPTRDAGADLAKEALVMTFQALATALYAEANLADALPASTLTPAESPLPDWMRDQPCVTMAGDAFAAHGIPDGAIVLFGPGQRAGSGDWVVYQAGEERRVGILRRRWTMYGWEIDGADGSLVTDEHNLLGPVTGLVVVSPPPRAPKRPEADA